MTKSILKYLWFRIPYLPSFCYRPKIKTYLFLPINGSGLGHLTRSLAIARRLKQFQPDAEIVFLTTSIGVTLVHREGFICHHVTPSLLLNTSAIEWNALFFKSLKNVLEIHKPHCLIFDGSVPYIGLQKIMHSYRRIKYVWIKRGLYKDGVDTNQLHSLSGGFKAIISPGELDKDINELEFNSKIYSVSPISLLDKSDLIEKFVARKLLHLVSDKPCVYVQLGAGNINGIADIQDRIIDVLKRKGLQVVVGQSPISINPKPDLRADSVIVDYPNSKYFRAFDFAVLAGGYNSVCEAVTLGLPALFIPNTETVSDDQVKRVQQACAFGNYEVIVEYSDDVFERAIDRLLTEKTKASDSFDKNGAVTAAEIIAQL